MLSNVRFLMLSNEYNGVYYKKDSIDNKYSHTWFSQYVNKNGYVERRYFDNSVEAEINLKMKEKRK